MAVRGWCISAIFGRTSPLFIRVARCAGHATTAAHGPHTGRTDAPPTAAMIPSRITDPRPSPLGRAHFPRSPPAEITARKFGVYTRLGINGMSGDDVANADD